MEPETGDTEEIELEIIQVTVIDPAEKPQSIHDFIMEMAELHDISLEDINELLAQCAVKAKADYAEYEDDDEFESDYDNLIGDDDDEEE